MRSIFDDLKIKHSIVRIVMARKNVSLGGKQFISSESPGRGYESDLHGQDVGGD